MTLRLYSWPQSSASGARWALEELGLSYEYVKLDNAKREHRTPEYLAINPNGKVPTLVDGDAVIWESNSILRYICNKQGGHALYPSDPVARSQVERWMDWQLASLNNPYLGIFKETKKPAAERGASWATDAKELKTQLDILEAGMGGQPWLAGQAMSLADICLGPIVHRCLDFPVELPGLASLRAWRDKVTARPAFKKATA